MSVTRVAAALLICACAAAAQTPPRISFSPVVRVSLAIDSATTARFEARGFDLRVGQAAASGSEVQLVKQAGAYTNELVRLSASGTRLPSIVIEVLDSVGAPAATVQLHDVVIVLDHLSLSLARSNLEQQRISQQEALSALTAEFQDAQRQLATLEELGKTRVATRQDLARARDRASDLERRIDLLKQRQALLASQIAGQGPLEESLLLRFATLEILTKS
jgi:hypothetical protein